MDMWSVTSMMMMDGAWRSETTMPAFNAIAVETPCAFVAVFMRGGDVGLSC